MLGALVGFRGGAVPFARIACGGERASPTATGGCEEPVAAQASDVHGLAAVDDRAVDEVDGLVAGDGDPGAAGHCASVAPRGLPPPQWPASRLPKGGVTQPRTCGWRK